MGLFLCVLLALADWHWHENWLAEVSNISAKPSASMKTCKQYRLEYNVQNKEFS